MNAKGKFSSDFTDRLLDTVRGKRGYDREVTPIIELLQAQYLRGLSQEKDPDRFSYNAARRVWMEATGRKRLTRQEKHMLRAIVIWQELSFEAGQADNMKEQNT